MLFLVGIKMNQDSVARVGMGQWIIIYCLKSSGLTRETKQHMESGISASLPTKHWKSTTKFDRFSISKMTVYGSECYLSVVIQWFQLPCRALLLYEPSVTHRWSNQIGWCLMSSHLATTKKCVKILSSGSLVHFSLVLEATGCV